MSNQEPQGTKTICTCGHSKGLHFGNREGLPVQCLVKGCECGDFKSSLTGNHLDCKTCGHPKKDHHPFCVNETDDKRCGCDGQSIPKVSMMDKLNCDRCGFGLFEGQPHHSDMCVSLCKGEIVLLKAQLASKGDRMKLPEHKNNPYSLSMLCTSDCPRCAVDAVIALIKQMRDEIVIKLASTVISIAHVSLMAQLQKLNELLKELEG